MKSKGTAAILAFFLGWIGVHRFYLGQGGLGFMYLLFCLTGIPAFVALIDFIAFLAMSNAAFDAKYNKVAVARQQGYQQANQSGGQQVVINNQHHFHGMPQPATPVTPPQPQAADSKPKQEDQFAQLERIHALKEKGVLTEEEFRFEKSKIMNGSVSFPPKPAANDDPFAQGVG